MRHYPADMKYIANIAALLLGLLFVMSGVVVLFDMVKAPPPPEGTPAAMFMGAFATTGYLKFIKILEVVGGILVAIPRTRNIGLLVLGPIVVNILAFHVFITGGQGVVGIPLGIALVSIFLLWVERHGFAALIAKNRSKPFVPAHQEMHE